MDIATAVHVPRLYVLQVTFGDGVQRTVAIGDQLYGEMFEPLRDPALFAQVTVDSVLGTVVWPNGADLSPEFLRECGAVPIHGSA